MDLDGDSEALEYSLVLGYILYSLWKDQQRLVVNNGESEEFVMVFQVFYEAVGGMSRDGVKGFLAWSSAARGRVTSVDEKVAEWDTEDVAGCGRERLVSA